MATEEDMSKTDPSTPHTEAPEDHIEKELEELEAPNWRKRPAELITMLVLAAVVVVAIWAVSKVERKKPVASTAPAVLSLELLEPKAGRQASPPTVFRWESISGTKYYAFRVVGKGAGGALIERSASRTEVRLTPEETARLRAGATYVFLVQAMSDTGRLLAEGRREFEL